ncbi:MAG: PD-(D/E)XK nuclease family protein [Candidatus Peregrinibacteria bacterium]|nr:PD-(D/E)XK nuclease family protein [Candidatus Peregrinibacteria bacterium]
MSDYYKVPRQPAWNYGGNKWKLSRSKIDLFLKCPKCFYIDNKLGIKRPPGYPFSLNSAVDALLKKEFDKYRAEQKPHPLMTANGIDAVPFQHEKIDEWRDALHAGVMFQHEPTGFLITGAVDDVWVKPDGELIVVDYKATSKAEEITALDKDWQDDYKRQSEVYEWLLRKNGFRVSDTAYFVYANGDTEKPNFDNKLEFDTRVIPYTGNDDWVEPTLLKIKECLESDQIPESGEDCDYCTFWEARNSVATTS